MSEPVTDSTVGLAPAEERSEEPDQTAYPGVREMFAWLGIGAVLAIVVSWPLVLKLGTMVPGDVGDPLLQAWQLAWIGHVMPHDPQSVFVANTFYPATPSLAFSDSLLGYAPFSVFGWGVEAAIVRYNVIFLLATALSFAGGALLARELRCPPVAAAATGAVFAYAPWHLTHFGHLNLWSLGGIPLALALLIGGYRRGRPRRVLAGWLLATWQISLGFGMGIYFAYLLALLVVALAIGWWRRGWPALDRRIWIATGVGVSILVGTVAVMAGPYLAVLHRYPESRRNADYIEIFSPPLKGLLIAPENSHFWGSLTEPMRRSLSWASEQTIFPGLVTVALAVAGLGLRRVPVRIRVLLAGCAALAALLSTGLHPGIGRWLYRPLYNYLPGIDAVRAPGRITVFMLIALGLLAALGVERILLGNWSTLTTRAVLAGVLVTAIIAEGSPTTFPLAEVPKPPAGLSSVPGPRFHLPTGGISDTWYMLWSADAGFTPVGNGYSGVNPAVTGRLREELKSFPSPQSIAVLRQVGFRSVVVHPDQLGGTPYSETLNRSVAGMGIRRVDHPGFVLYDLFP